MSRKVTNTILEMIEEGILDKDTVIMACLKYMSEDDVADMAHCNEFIVEEEESTDDDTIEEEEEECPLALWYDTTDELL